MRDFTDDSIANKNELESEWPFIWLYEIVRPTSPKTVYRMTNYNESIIHRANTFYPAPVKHLGITLSGRGDLPSIDFAIGDPKANIMPIVEGGDGYIGQRARVILINVFEVANDNAGHRFDGEITAASMRGATISVTISARDLYRAKIPPFRYAKRKCRFLLADGNCGYLLIGGSQAAAFSKCPGYTFEACERVGEDETARGLAVRHPFSFGGFPGVPRPKGSL